MKIWINTISNDTGCTIIQVAGELRGLAVDEFQRSCREISGPLCLDLSDLRSMETEAVQFIQTLVRQGVKLRGATPYVELLLAEGE